MASFRNDYSYLAHPRILKALERVENELQVAYGLDCHSKNAANYIRDVFGAKDADVHFLAGGTQTNMVFISGALKSYQGVIAAASGHINVHESGAIEGSGHKIFTMPGTNGKISGDDIRRAMALNPDEHTVSLGLVYISNSTEIGTIYSKMELQKLRDACNEFGLLLFIDGARLGSALTSNENDVDPTLIGKIADGFTVGGTKNGMLYGEALVIVNPSLKKGFRNHIKNKGAMLAKGFVVGVQFEEAFRDGLYFELAEQTNRMADLLKEGLGGSGLSLLQSPTNQIFVTLKKEVALKIIDRYGCELWEDKGPELTIRFVTSFKTSEDDVKEAVSFIKSIL